MATPLHPDGLGSEGQQAPDPFLGTVLRERYQISRLLGRGGFGVVYLARDQTLSNRLVVVKVLHDAAFRDEWVRRRFQQEVEALARIDHPGIVSVLDTGLAPDGKPFFVMQFIDGVNLRTVLKHGRLPLPRAGRMLRQLGNALAAAHELGILHRDLKPENIMLRTLTGEEEQVRVIDFGLARMTEGQAASSTSQARVAGTGRYMAPEQLMAHEPSIQDDIYAVGIIAYELVTGQCPFKEGSAFDQISQRWTGVQVRPRVLCPELPDVAEALLLKSLAFEPSQRPASVRALTEPLATALLACDDGACYISSVGHLSVGLSSSLTTSQTLNPTLELTPSAALGPSQLSLAGLRVSFLQSVGSQVADSVRSMLEPHLRAEGCQLLSSSQIISGGSDFTREITRQIRVSDVVIPLVTPESAQSQTLAFEVQVASEEARRTRGRPLLIPIRVGFSGAFPESLAPFLESQTGLSWTGAADESRVVEGLLRLLRRPQPAALSATSRGAEHAGGAVPLDSAFYLERSADETFHSALRQQESIVLLKGPRQIGKTSLLARGLQQVRTRGAKVVLTDFQKLSSAHLESSEALFSVLMESIADQLDLDIALDKFWGGRLGPAMNFERFLRRGVLSKITTPLVWGLDEVDRLFSCSFGNEVFGLFRSWHNDRSLDPSGPWNRLTLAIAHATEPHLFIRDLNQSPFNVGLRLSLTDFTLAQVAELNTRYGEPLRDIDEVGQFTSLVGGHPYLTQRGLQEMVDARLSLEGLEALADRPDGPFGDHLQRVQAMVMQDDGLREAVVQVLQGHPCSVPERFFRLRSAGILGGDSAQTARLRCRLYARSLESALLKGAK